MLEMEGSMAVRRSIAIVGIVALALIIFGIFAHAQAPVPSGGEAKIVSGSDIGFRVERPGKDSVGGTLMVRINGKWVPAEPVEKPRLTPTGR
jgi:hypothetical protein